METVILVSADQTDFLNHWNGCVVYVISEPKLTFKAFLAATAKEAPKSTITTMGEIDSD